MQNSLKPKKNFKVNLKHQNTGGYPKPVKQKRIARLKKPSPQPVANRHNDHCTYCGDFNQCQDHMIPRAYSHEDYKKASRPNKHTVDCCQECNTIAGAYPAFSVKEKADFLLSSYLAKYKSILNLPKWTDLELNELDHTLRQQIKANENLRRLVTAKLNNLRLTSLGADSIAIWPDLHFFWA